MPIYLLALLLALPGLANAGGKILLDQQFKDVCLQAIPSLETSCVRGWSMNEAHNADRRTEYAQKDCRANAQIAAAVCDAFASIPTFRVNGDTFSACLKERTGLIEMAGSGVSNVPAVGRDIQECGESSARKLAKAAPTRTLAGCEADLDRAKGALSTIQAPGMVSNDHYKQIFQTLFEIQLSTKAKAAPGR